MLNSLYHADRWGCYENFGIWMNANVIKNIAAMIVGFSFQQQEY